MVIKEDVGRHARGIYRGCDQIDLTYNSVPLFGRRYSFFSGKRIELICTLEIHLENREYKSLSWENPSTVQ
jgi:hypothetical protein